MGYSLGIDLGTTYSAAAVARDGAAVEVSTLGTTGASIPSVVVLREDGEILTGEAAERRAPSEPTRSAREFKRRLGDPVPLIIGTTPYGAEALMALLLRDIVGQVEAREGSAADLVVLTHPANYSDYKRGLLEEAARLAGLDLTRVRFLSEPQAAAVAYAAQQRVEPGEVVAIYDFGGGTFDAAVVRKDEDGAGGFRLLGNPEGMERLGGIDLDQAVLAHVDAALDGMVTSIGAADPTARPSIARLRDEVRRAKEALSTDTDCSIAVSLPGLQTEVRLTREELEAMIRPRLVETVDALRRAVVSAGVPFESVSRVLLVGGSSRIPLVGLLVRELTGRPVAVDAHPKLAIATGAAIAGAAERVVEPAPAPVVVEGQAVAPVAPVRASMLTKPRLGALGAVAGVGVVAAGAGAALLAGGAPAAAAAGLGAAGGTMVTGAGLAGVGPAGLAGVPATAGVGPAGVAPAGAGSAGAGAAGAAPAGPAGTGRAGAPGGGAGAAGAGPAAASGRAAAKVAKTANKVPIAVAAAVGVVAAVAAVVAVTSGGDDPPAEQTSTTIEAAAAATTSPETPVASTTVPSGGRGVTGATAIVAGLPTDNTGKGVPGPATAASLGAPAYLALAPDGDVFLIDSAVPRVLRIADDKVTVAFEDTATIGGLAVGPTGRVVVLTTKGLVEIAGDGKSTVVASLADLGAGVGPGLQTPMAFDGAGNLFIGSSNSYRILRRATDGAMSHVAGTGQFAGIGPPQGDGGPAASAPLAAMTSLLVDGQGNLLVGHKGGAVRKVSGDGTITTIGGAGATKLLTNTGTFVDNGTKAVDIDFADVDALALDPKGRIYVGDSQSGAIVRILADGTIEFVAGDQSGVVEPKTTARPANQTRVAEADGLTFDRTGALLVLDAGLLLRIEDVATG